MNVESKINIRIYTIREVKDWIYCGINNGLTEYVISNARALAIVNNPYAEDAYPAITVAFNEDNQPISYGAVVADSLDGKPIFWATTGYTDLSVRGQGIGTRVYSAMRDACNQQWFVSDASQATLAISKKMGLITHYYDCYYLSFYSSSALKSKLRAWQVCRTNNRVLRNLQTQTRLEVLRYIDDKTFAFITQHAEHNLFHRSQAMLNWILQYPFKACAPTDVASYSRYEFTAARSQYTIYAFRILLDYKLIGFAMLRLVMGKLTLLYIYKDMDYTSDVYAALVKHMLSQDIIFFRTFDKELIDYYNQIGAKSMNAKSRVQQVSLSVPADRIIDKSLTLQCGDGDMFA